MKYYNLLGQFSYTKGGTNPDAPEAGPYVYTEPPGFGDNKGLIVTSFTEEELDSNNRGSVFPC